MSQITVSVQHQPREHSVPCRGCRRETWEFDALCVVCRKGW